MQQFRPADVIEQDSRIAESLVDGDVDALDTLVARYGRAVEAVVAGEPHDDRSDRAADVFARAWLDRRSVEIGSDFAPWIAGFAAAVAGRPIADVESTWAVALAIDAIDPEARAVLRAHHVGGRDLPESEDRHELRLRRRLIHLGDDAVVAAALLDPAPWADPADDLMARVRARVRGAHNVDGAEGFSVADDGDAPEDAAIEDPPSRVTRSLRPVLLGLAGAVVVLFVAIVALSAASGSPDPIAFTADLTSTGAILDVEGGVLTVTERGAGLQLELEAPTLPRRAGDQFYEGVLVLTDGSEQPTGTFNEGVDVTMSSGVVLDRVEAFLVVAREAGSDSGQTVLKVDVPRR